MSETTIETGAEAKPRKGKKAKTVVLEATAPVESAPTTDLAPEEPKPTKKGGKKPKGVVAEAAPPVETDPSADPAPEEPKPRKGGKTAKPAATLADVAEGYLKALEDEGKSAGTCFSYRLELALALSELGPETPASELTVERVTEFFACERVDVRSKGRVGQRAGAPHFVSKRQIQHPNLEISFAVQPTSDEATQVGPVLGVLDCDS